MSNLAILPILLPFLTGILTAFFHKKLPLVRSITIIMSIVTLLTSLYIANIVFTDAPILLEAGDWMAPFGIVLVADGLAMTLVIVTDLIAVACAIYAMRSLDEERERFYFYTFFQLLIAGVSGAFLTGDLFNLFVFFEVLLMASYGLIILGGTKEQLRESLKYVLINVFSSMLFVTTVAFLYSVTGTLNMAHLAERVQLAEQQGILTTISILLFLVFATKGALFPLYFWLPKSYAVPNPVISALFGALLTKVGVYSILRVFTLIFIYKTDITHELFIILAGITMLMGVVGALSTYNVKLIVAYNIIPAVGFMIMGIGIYNETALSGTVYYLIHDMIVKGALFLLAGAMIKITGTADLRKMGGLIRNHQLLAWLFLIATVTLAGIPPFSGFIGKFLLIKGGFENGNYIIVGMALLSSLLILLSVLRIFINGFWGEAKLEPHEEKGSEKGMILPITLLLTFSVLLGIGAEWFIPYVEQITETLTDPSIYVNTVLKES
ncbi:Na+/H+ antiporter subunit D [Bacillus solimangrovi]|uniref:Na+/H+ antiporter subunit D n=1 Tax=Bacillus solimangrovi TaxID=1305675 RepID=A0A1E5LHW8_9BACI|nr:Na+/H+ antiporter subunit D [Bacillus solimangrovi]OEH93667.1 Na+/H+ antiporter subunit D [Bacillus solimangrovi]